MVRVRIAPSPTGYPHIGTIYQALFNYAYAKKHTGKFIVRIEDTDRERFVEDAEEKIFTSLDWFSLQEDESPRKGGPFAPYRQSERLEIYKKYAEELVEKGHAYYCFCSKERLEEVRKKLQEEKKSIMYDKFCRNLSPVEVTEKLQGESPWVIRLKVPQNETISINDELRGEVRFDANLIDDQVLLKSDGFPTYHLAVVVDDHLMEITHVVRGEEWLPSTPKHILLYRFFEWQPPFLFHTPTLRNPDKSKLSKRHGHTNVTWYNENGFLPEAILNFLALMGWGHPEGKEIFDLEEFIRLFDLKDIKVVGPIFDITKLAWLNGEYIRAKDTQTLKKLLYEYYQQYDPSVLPVFTSAHIDLLVDLAKTRMKTLKDFALLVQEAASEYVLTNEDKIIGKALYVLLEQITDQDWKNDMLLEKLKMFQKDPSFAKASAGRQKTAMKKIYLLLTGKEQGLPLLETITEIHGRTKVLKDLRQRIE